MGKQKQAKKTSQVLQKKAVRSTSASSDSEKIIWVFDKPDTDGEFAFRIADMSDRDIRIVFDKMMLYESMTWSEAKQQTHDKDARSKHHHLDFEGMSKQAQDRIRKLDLGEETDAVFSFALTNKLRIIGIRDGRLFHVKWYDPEHRFYPSKR